MNRHVALMLGLAAVATAPFVPQVDYSGVVTGPRPKHVSYSALPTGARTPPRPSQAKRRKRARR